MAYAAGGIGAGLGGLSQAQAQFWFYLSCWSLSDALGRSKHVVQKIGKEGERWLMEQVQ